jgi:RNA polymerase sigma factor (sigma-70 family)
VLAGGTKSDADLIVESLSRPEAFAPVFDRHFHAVHRYLARRAGVGTADDLASQTFLVAFRRRAAFREESDSALPWLFGIASRLLSNHGRSEQSAQQVLQRLRSVDGGGQRPANGATDALEDVRAELLSVALQSLTAEHRDVLLLHAWADLSYEEIAEGLAIPVGTVRSRLARARAQVRAVVASSMAVTKEAER